MAGPIVTAVTRAILDAQGHIELHEQYLKQPAPDIYYREMDNWIWKLPRVYQQFRNIKQFREI